MKHRIFSRTSAALLSVMLIAGLLPTTVFAAENYNINVAGTPLTSDNASDVLGDGTVSYDHKTKTLTLNNAELNGGILISQENVVNISIQGDNSITSNQYGIAKNAWPNDPAAPGGLFVSGPGSLEVNAQTNGIESYRELVIDNVDLKINTGQFSLVAQNEREITIRNGSDITATSETFSTVLGGGIHISDSKTEATAKAGGVNVLFASSGNISIDNSAVEATGTSEEAYPAIYAVGNININNKSNVKATSSGQQGLYAKGDINVTDKSNVEATSSGRQGIMTKSDMTVTDSTVTAVSTEEGGVYIYGTLSLTNSELFASSNPQICAIVTQHFDVTNSEVTAKGGLLLEPDDDDNFSFSITPANGKLAEFKVDRDRDGSAAVHFKETNESPYDTTVTFNAKDRAKINTYSYIHIGEHIHTGGTATCETPAVCADCGRTYGTALGHSAVKTEEKKATCTEDGNREYWYCDACGKYFGDEALTEEIQKEETIIKATGHDIELKNVKEATCTAEGYTGDKVCGVCGEVIERGKAIPKLAHSYKDGECTVCGAADPNYKPGTASPETGDSSNMILWMLLLAAGSGVLGASIYQKRKHS